MKLKRKLKALGRNFGVALLVGFTFLGSCGGPYRDQIEIVGPSTVNPFASLVAQAFGQITDHPTPAFDSTGSDDAHELFYAGTGALHPDLVTSPRRMTRSEFEKNLTNGIEVIEIEFGSHGIAFAQDKSTPVFDLTLEQITLAVAEKVPDGRGGFQDNNYETWNQIDPSLPDREIQVFGPPIASKARDAFHKLILHEGAKALEYPDGMDGKEDGKVEYQAVRGDNCWTDSGNNNLIVQKLLQTPDALGLFGYSFFVQNESKIAAVKINGQAPDMASLSSGSYAASHNLYFYVKKNHLEKVPGIEEYIDLFLSSAMAGPNGALKAMGLVPLPDTTLTTVRQRWADRQILTEADFQ